jgi:hypothetical protein
LKKNLRTIITAVISAAVIWFAISLQIFPDVTETITDIPVQIITTSLINDDLDLVKEYNLYTSVQVRGQRRHIGNLTAADFRAELDFSGVDGPGSPDVPIIITPLSQNSFEIVRGENNTQQIEIKRIASRTFSVDSDTGDFLIPRADFINVVEGMRIEELTVTPSTVTIKGEKSLIDSIERIEIQAIHNEEVIRSLEVGGRLTLFNYAGIEVSNPEIQLDSTSFSVTIPIHRVRTLDLDFVITRAPGNFDLRGLREKMVINPSVLTLSAPNTSIDLIPSFEVGIIPLRDITLEMLQGITRDTFESILAGTDYKYFSDIHSYALYFTGVDDYIEYDFYVPRENITVLHSPTGYNVEIMTQELRITVVGPASYVHVMTASDINLTLNLIGTEITADARIDTKNVDFRISGTDVPAWVIGTPRVDVSFTRIE